MKKKTAWTGTYYGVNYEINNYTIQGIGDCWTFYLYIRLAQLPADEREQFWLEPKEGINERHAMYEYYDTIIGSLTWHGGCTYYQKIGGFDGHPRLVKIGCDYQHYFDEGRYYTLLSIQGEVKDCIDSLRSMIPDLKTWCTHCGVFFLPESDESVCPKCVKI